MYTIDEGEEAVAMATRVWWAQSKIVPTLYDSGSGVYSVALCRLSRLALKCKKMSADTATNAEDVLREALWRAIHVWRNTAEILPTKYDSSMHTAGHAIAIVELCEAILSDS